MTKEETIEILKTDSCVDCGVGSQSPCVCTFDGHCDIKDAMNMAIKALEQQPSDDCVSRKAVLDKAELIELNDGQSFMCIDPEDVKALPSVTPTHCIATVRFSKEDLREICNERIEIECTHGMCKDCTKSKILNDFEGSSIVCNRFGRMAVKPDFYCADFEKRGNENGTDNILSMR